MTTTTATRSGSPVTAAPHDPVMVERITALLARPDAAEPALLVDATVGAGGHAAELLAASGPRVSLVGLDRDPGALELASERLAAFGDRVLLVHAPYDALPHVLPPLVAQRGPVRGVLYDLGVSSMQLDRPERGFSFRADAPLDMRMDPGSGVTAAELLDGLDAPGLARLLSTYGEERFARRIAEAIVRARPVRTTGQLAAVVQDALPAAVRYRGGPTHPATRTFQALRIAVNAELDRLRASLPQARALVGAAAGVVDPGRIAVLAYHSGEDRIVKQDFAVATRGCICPPELPVCGCGRSAGARLLTRGAEVPDAGEVERNPRARSARLRALEVLTAGGG